MLSHCSYHQYSERFILAVTAGPPQKEILVWDRWSGHIHTVGLYSPRKDRMAFLHDNMHPAWSADACTLAFDSTHTGQGWQVCCSEYHSPCCYCHFCCHRHCHCYCHCYYKRHFWYDHEEHLLAEARILSYVHMAGVVFAAMWCCMCLTVCVSNCCS